MYKERLRGMMEACGTLTKKEIEFTRVTNVIILKRGLGFGAGPLLFGPASVYILSGACYSAFSFEAAFAPNAGSLIVLRFLYVCNSIIVLVLNLCGQVEPQTGMCQQRQTQTQTRNGLQEHFGVCAKSTDHLMPLPSLAVLRGSPKPGHLRPVLSVGIALVPETHGPTILKWRIAKEGDTPPPPLKFDQIVSVFKIALDRPIIYIFTEPVVMFVSLYLSIIYGILYGFFEAFTVVYLKICGFTTTSYGLTYISLGLGFLVACILLRTTGQALYLKSTKVDAARDSLLDGDPPTVPDPDSDSTMSCAGVEPSQAHAPESISADQTRIILFIDPSD
ncbi:hypothetical protein DFH07DRAFT_766982 [Mycena maculata]|uniref:Uncharacterized protein n=1 Tax=Mycena maculata TaxID=230809 RepID=A0AAD7K153_9AGAR|nr:hypothetical protein DFH07DRAFT_766982 [Mycena maculata]